MTPQNLFKKYLNQFNKLIDEGDNIQDRIKVIPGTPPTEQQKRYGGPRGMGKPDKYEVDTSMFEVWKVNCISLLDQIIPLESAHRKQIEVFDKLYADTAKLEKGISILKALRKDYEEGFLKDILLQIESEIAADYMNQAEKLLADKQPGEFNHVPAAVLSGAVLEKTLRTLCEKQNPPIKIVNEKGHSLTFEPLIDELKRKKVFNDVVAKQLKFYATIRNKAAHGNFTEFNRDQVKGMISGIKTFLEEYMMQSGQY